MGNNKKGDFLQSRLFYAVAMPMPYSPKRLHALLATPLRLLYPSHRPAQLPISHNPAADRALATQNRLP